MKSNPRRLICSAWGSRRVGSRHLMLSIFPLALFAAMLGAQSPVTGLHCDPDLIPASGNPLAYQLRGERCEGLYVLEVFGGGGLTMAALTEAGRPFEIADGTSVVFGWSTPEPLPLRLRAVSLRRQTYYRMDASVSARARMFSWPTEVLVALGMSSRELGLVASTDYPLGERMVQLFIPLRWGANPSGVPRGSYEVVVIPGTELEEAYLTLAAVGRMPEDFLFLKRDEPLDYGYYPEQRPIRVALPTLPRAGIYQLKMTALHRRGGSSSMAVYFFHPGAPHE